MESYDQNRQLIMSFELVSYNYGNEDHQSSTDDKSGSNYPKIAGLELPVFILAIFILIILILIGLLMAVRRHRQKRAVFADQIQKSAQTYQTTTARPQPRSAQDVKFETVDDTGTETTNSLQQVEPISPGQTFQPVHPRQPPRTNN